MKSLACMNCGNGYTRYRGCCVKCYTKFRNWVKQGHTTWESLIKNKCCLDVKKKEIPLLLQKMWNDRKEKKE